MTYVLFRSLSRWATLLLCILVAFGPVAAQERERGGEAKPLVQMEGKLVWLGVRPDFLELFQDDSSWALKIDQWRNAARHIRVVKFSTQFYQAVPDADLARIVRNLRQQNIALGLESLAQNWYKEIPECGHGVEGYSDPGAAKRIVDKLKRAGGALGFVAMDEPLWFGHYYRGKNACNSSIDNVAKRAAVIIGIYTTAFPKVIVGDIEPFPALSSEPNWAADWDVWVKAFRQATGRDLAFLHMDFDWGAPSINMRTDPQVPDPLAIAQLAKTVASVVRANGLQVGMIYNGREAAATSEIWMQQARSHIEFVESSGIEPEHISFDSWVKYPIRALPETDSSALSSLVLHYFARQR